MLQVRARSYVCWRYVSRMRPAPSPLRASWLGFHPQTYSTIEGPDPERGLESDADPSQPPPILPPDSTSVDKTAGGKIREMLRRWEAENPEPSFPGRSVGNVPATTSSGLFSTEPFVEVDTRDDEDEALLPESPHVDPVFTSMPLKPGDLIEMNTQGFTSTAQSSFAICLGTFSGVAHFYQDTGKWLVSGNVNVRFLVKGFIQDPGLLQPVLDAIPSGIVADDVLNQLRQLRIGPSRVVGASLLRTMVAFKASAQEIYQSQVDTLAQAARTVVQDKEQLLSLTEIASLLLPPGLKKGADEFPPEALYAVHMALAGESGAFVPLPNYARAAPFFRIASRDDLEIGYHMSRFVRSHLLSMAKDGPTAAAAAARGSQLAKFAAKCRLVIDASRKRRPLSTCGMIGPMKPGAVAAAAAAKDGGGGEPAPASLVQWSPSDLVVIRFMTLVASCTLWQAGSRHHGTAAVVLRAIDRYEQFGALGADAAWTFLQEIGWLTPWELASRLRRQLPGVPLSRRAGFRAAEMDDKEITLEPDRLASLRQDHAGLVAYAVDSSDTIEVDDAISVEKAEDGGEREYWVHIHVADPASRIRPGTWLAERAELLSSTMYLPGHFEPMFKNPRVREAFSLASGRPCLTFSAKLNEAGEMLDHKVTPGIMRHVVSMTPQEFESVYTPGGEKEDGRQKSAPGPAFYVGVPPPPQQQQQQQASREMTRASELAPSQVADIQTLSRLADGLHQKRLARGAMPRYLGGLDVPVGLGHSVRVTEVATGTGHSFLDCVGDPYIAIVPERDDPGDRVVASMMVLAGEVAARWCGDRAVAAPFRVQPVAEANRTELDAFVRAVYYPLLLAGVRPDPQATRTMNNLRGGTVLSTTPGPMHSMGLTGYVKVTSPLRRYLDLLAHWQIEAALLAEAEQEQQQEKQESKKLGGQTVPSSSLSSSTIPDRTIRTIPEAKLPFSKAVLDGRVLPRQFLRERNSVYVHRAGEMIEYPLQALVRAWKFGDGPAGQLPASFRFEVLQPVEASRLGSGLDSGAQASAAGKLDWFDMPATVLFPAGTGSARPLSSGSGENAVVAEAGERKGAKEEGMEEGPAAFFRADDVKPGDVFEVKLRHVQVTARKIWVDPIRKIE